MREQVAEYLDVVEARHVAGHKVCVQFNDGFERVIDFGPFLRKTQNPDLEKYRALSRFKTFQVHSGNLIWGDYEMVFPVSDLHAGKIER
jgi:hypothetical protein